MFERGFKTWCERIAAELRKALNVGSTDPLPEAVPHIVNCRRGNVGRHNKNKTICKHGHPLSGPNLKIRVRTDKGTGIERSCRSCLKNRHQA